MNAHLSLSRLSIQQRLIILICTLLLSSIVIYGFANYYSLKNTILAVGKDRLSSITKQVGAILGGNTLLLINTANKTAAQNTTIQCLESGGKEFRKETLDAMDKLHRDS